MRALLASLVLSSVLGIKAELAIPEPRETRFFHEPAACGNRIVFVHGNDLWSVPAAGGAATPLLSSAAKRSNPACSPDGRSVAFSEEADGNVDAYVVGLDGGTPRRLTWHPSIDRVQGWSPDNSLVLFTSDSASEHFLPRLMRRRPPART